MKESSNMTTKKPKPLPKVTATNPRYKGATPGMVAKALARPRASVLGKKKGR